MVGKASAYLLFLLGFSSIGSSGLSRSLHPMLILLTERSVLTHTFTFPLTLCPGDVSASVSLIQYQVSPPPPILGVWGWAFLLG